jgi:YD repeat-containing protein
MIRSALTISLFCFFGLPAMGQVTPDLAKGLTPFAAYSLSDIDNVNPANGNLFLKLPLVAFPQKGSKLHLGFSIYYNDKQWSAPLSIVYPSSGDPYYTMQWSITGTPSVGAYVARDQTAMHGADFASYSTAFGSGYSAYSLNAQVASRWVMGPDGAKHYVGDTYSETCSPTQNCSSFVSPGFLQNSYIATDGSGFRPSGDNSYDANGILYGASCSLPDWQCAVPSVTDPNGNSITTNSTGWVDSFNNSIPGQFMGTGSFAFPNATSATGNGAYWTDLIPGVPFSGDLHSVCPSVATSARTWTVPASQNYSDGSHPAGTSTYYLCYQLMPFQTSFGVTLQLPPANNPSGAPAPVVAQDVSSASQWGYGDALMLIAIVLPDGNSYTFQYDAYLSLINLGLPTGASISYQWKNVMFNASLSPNTGQSPMSRALLSRTVIPGSGQPSIATQYQWVITPNKSPSQGNSQYRNFNGVQFPAYSVVTDSNGNDVEYTLGGSDDAGIFWPDYVITAIAWYSGCSPHDPASGCNSNAGTRLKSQSFVLTPSFGLGAAAGTGGALPPLYGIPPVKQTQITTHIPAIGGDLTSTVVNSLAPSFGACTRYDYPVNANNPTFSQGIGPSQEVPSSYSFSNSCFTTGQMVSSATYDFGAAGGGAGSLLNTETTQYNWEPNNCHSMSASYPCSSFSPLSTISPASNELELVDFSTVADGSGSWAAETDQCYDSNGNGASIQRFSSSPSSHSCSTPPSSALITSTTYSQGVITSMTDARGHSTLLQNFACNGSLPQTVVLPDSQQIQYTYDCNTGKVTQHKDSNGVANGFATTYSYTDPLNRLTSVSYPDGGGASVCYSDDSGGGCSSSGPLTMTETISTGEAAGSKIITANYDGLARPTTTTVQAQSAGSLITTQTNYDNMGRVQAVSNPYYSTSDTTFGWTSTAYDALGRPVYRCNPDNGTSSGSCAAGTSYQQWSYNGNITTSTDENRGSWQRTTDALGRLAQVVEPGSLHTNYLYNALGDLTCAVQMGTTSSGFTNCAAAQASWRPRIFTYDGVSRLESAANPESGSLSYTYDKDGNVLSKTDARGMTTAYSYDSLNRLTSKTYSSNDHGNDPMTPIVCFQYDASSISGAGTNLIGRVTNEWTQPFGTSCTTSGSGFAPASGSYMSLKSFLAYDKMGRPTSIQQQQCVGSTCSAPAPYALNLSYDLVGNVTQLQNSVGNQGAPLTLTNYYDAVSRPCLTTSSWNGTFTWGGGFPANLFQANPSASATTEGYAAVGIQNWFLGSSSTSASTDCSSSVSSPINLTQGYSKRLWVNSTSATGQVP